MAEDKVVSARAKIKSIERLGELAAEIKANGGTVVMAHGVFDLLHMGHVRHLEEARSYGTALFVTVTPDHFVNKGPGRPVFPEAVRAEMLAALDCVAYTGINFAPSSEEAIETIKPDIYVKGQEYAEAQNDVTGKIDTEKAAVERNGGCAIFTNDVIFSSSELINRHLNPFDPEVSSFLRQFQNNQARDSIFELLGKASGLKVLVIGDAILDEYCYVTPMSKPPKENLIATKYEEHELFAGGIFATANHAASICSHVDIITAIGRDDPYTDLIRKSLKPNVRLHAFEIDGIPTTLKRRYVDINYLRKLFEVYHFDDSPIPRHIEEELNQLIRKTAADYDLIIVNDFGHGLLQNSTIKILCEHAPYLAVNTQTNSANFGYNLITRYPRVDYVCIDGSEARLAAGDKFSPMESVIRDKLADKIDCPLFVVTQGRHGSIAVEPKGPTCDVPAFADKVIDTVGAVDAFLAITAPLAALGGDLRHIAFMGNVAGALKVGIVGHRKSIDKPSLVKAVTALLK